LSAHAEWRCDCTTIVDTCSATVTVEDAGVSVESDHPQCSRVDYLIDGLPFVTLVVEGRERQNWLSRSEKPEVLMQSCQVCRDNADAPLPVVTPRKPGPASEPSREAKLPRLLAVEPQYPPSAAAKGIDGFVDVSFTVSALGRVDKPKVTAAEPPGVFEEAALSAISRWRYGADEGREPVALTHRFNFKSEDAIATSSGPSRANAEAAVDQLIARSVARLEGEAGDTAAASRAPGSAVRNDCIREQASYDFGEMVEVDLMNACSEPLMVYSCAKGTGRYLLRWVCQSTENAQSVLVRPGDRLAGNVAMIDIPDGMRTFTYAENLAVARYPNSEYWWLACGVDDTECRGSGRQWARSMRGKAATVDPQLWTAQSLARSN
jgi:protein TonB